MACLLLILATVPVPVSVEYFRRKRQLGRIKNDGNNNKIDAIMNSNETASDKKRAGLSERFGMAVVEGV